MHERLVGGYECAELTNERWCEFWLKYPLVRLPFIGHIEPIVLRFWRLIGFSWHLITIAGRVYQPKVG
jgi:hypothetical protein